MSFLAEVVASIDTTQLTTISEQIPELINRKNLVLREALGFIDDTHKYFKVIPKKNKILSDKLNGINNETIEVLKRLDEYRIKNIKDCNIDLDHYALQLNNLNVRMMIAKEVIEVHDQLIEMKEFRERKLYLNSLLACNKIIKKIESIPSPEQLDAVTKILHQALEERSILVNNLKCLVNDNFIIKQDNERASIEIKQKNVEMQEALRTLAYFRTEISAINKMSKFLWIHVLEPIVYSNIQLEILNNDNFHVLQTKQPKKKENCTYSETFAKIIDVLMFLKTNADYDVHENINLSTYIGNELREKLSDALIKNCLQRTIPTSSKGLEEYNTVIEDVNTFQEKLKEIGFFSSNSTSLLYYASNVDVHFINNKCREYVKIATEIMKKDLHTYIEVGDPFDVDIPLSSQPFTFHKRAVSKNAVELLNLAESILEKAITSSEVCAGRLTCTIQNIFHLYGTIVLESHQKLLQTIPQQVALFYNNCNYMAHQLKSWGELYRSKLPSSIVDNVNNFENERQLLETLGQDKFNECVQEQAKLIEEIVADSGLKQAKTLDKLEQQTEKSIRQCLRQQELLKTVWCHVLSYPDYNSTLGFLLDNMCRSIVNVVIDFEDISADAAEQLVDVLKVVLSRGAKLFVEPKEVTLYVESWHKLNELVFVLSNRLVDINDRWANGKGPLGLYFKAYEVKKLIRALFQNTDMRAAVLAKILD